MEKNLDTLLANQKSSRQLQEEQEEKERLELVKELKRDKETKPTEKITEDKKTEKDVSNIDVDGKILKIKRKVYDIEGNAQEELITIKNPEGISGL